MNNLSCNLIELVVLTIPKTQKNENVASCEKKMQQTYRLYFSLMNIDYALCFIVCFCVVVRTVCPLLSPLPAPA